MDDVVAKLLGYGWPGIIVLIVLGGCVALWRARERDLERGQKAVAESLAREQKALEESRAREQKALEESRVREQKAIEARVGDAQTMTATLLQQLREGNNASNALAQATCDLTDEIRRAMERFERNERSQR